MEGGRASKKELVRGSDRQSPGVGEVASLRRTNALGGFLGLTPQPKGILWTVDGR